MSSSMIIGLYSVMMLGMVILLLIALPTLIYRDRGNALKSPKLHPKFVKAMRKYRKKCRWFYVYKSDVRFGSFAHLHRGMTLGNSGVSRVLAIDHANAVSRHVRRIGSKFVIKNSHNTYREVAEVWGRWMVVEESHSRVNMPHVWSYCRFFR